MKQLYRWYFVFVLAISTFSGWSQDHDVFVREQLSKRNLNADSNSWSVTSSHMSSTSKTRHIYYQQLLEGIPVKGSESSVHVSPAGEVLLEHNRFVQDISVIKNKGVSVSVTPSEAIERVIQKYGYIAKSEIRDVKHEKDHGDYLYFTNGGISMREIPVRMVYAKDLENKLRLAWEVAILEPNYEHYMLVEIDAITGEVFNSEDILQRCAMSDESNSEKLLDYNANLYDIPNYEAEDETICEVCYEVFASPYENPFSGERVIVQEPADPVASPFGWHDTDGESGSESFKTAGNNVFVVEMGDNRGYQSYGGERLDFTNFSFNPLYTLEDQSEDAALINVFYWNNLVHDITFHYGFDEYSGNFQRVNYYAEGPDRREMEARVQSRIGCNAYFIVTVSGGEKVIMVMGLCDDKDSSFDNMFIVHEYVHGIVYRLIGSAVGGCVGNDERMTEGWADWLGLMLTIDPTDDRADRRPFGNFFFGQGPEGRGIRRYPYCTDFEVNPQTYDSIKSASIPHGVGAVWGTMLWDMTWDLIDAYGYDPDLTNFTGDVNQDAGNIMALAIVIEGMKLMACSPGFIDAREAILTANRSIYGWGNDCVIFNAFARRGLGLSAKQGLTTSAEDGTEDFTDYPEVAEFDDVSPICWNNGVIEGLGVGLPFGGVYSGPGVIDDGNGITFSIDSSISGIGEIEITYTVEDTYCVFASTATTTVLIEHDETPPEIICPEDVVLEIPVGEGYLLPSYIDSVIVTDNCLNAVTVTQDPEEFYYMEAGEHLIELLATDEAGNTNTCTFVFKLLEIGNQSLDFKEVVQLFPNPATSEVTIYNPDGSRILNISIYDIYGKLLTNIAVQSSEVYIPIDVEKYASGNYFFIIEGAGDTIVRRMVKF